MRLGQALAPVLVMALMVAPPWLQAHAQAPGLPTLTPPVNPPAPDPLARLLQDLQGFLGQAQQVADEVAPSGVPSVPAAQQRLNATLDEAREEALETALTGPIRTLFYEGFEGRATLPERGWGQEVVRGEAPWGIVDAINKTVVRGDGGVFTPEFETGESPIAVKDGQKAATILNPRGRYDPRVDARLISPVIDLRYVRGAAARPDDAYDKLTQDPEFNAPYQLFLGFWRGSVAPLSVGTAITSVDKSFTWILVTPPSKLQRLFLRESPGAVSTCGVPAGGATGLAVSVRDLAPCGNQPGDIYFLNPLASRYGASLVNLTFHHRYDLAVQKASVPPEYEDAVIPPNQDGVFLEARVVNPDGSVGPWEHLHGDAVFETQLDRGMPVPSPSFGSRGSLVTRGALSSLRIPLSGVAETIQGRLADEEEYSLASSFYNGRVLLRGYSECYGLATQRVDCQPDAPAFVEHSGGSRWKSHFTLNRFAGHQIQLAWRVHSGVGTVQREEFGWFVDAVKVEALLPLRDPGVHEVAKPRRGDVVPTTALIQPEALVRNYGYMPVENVTVEFTIEEDVPAANATTLAEAARGDADRLAGAVAAGLANPPPGVPGVPGGSVGLVQQQLQAPRVLLKTSLTVPTIPGLGEVAVQSPLPCTACAPGKYRLRVQVLSMPLSGGSPGSLPPDRTEDGSSANNNLTVRFEVRDVVSARLRLSVPSASVLTDINEPKTFRVDLQNTGNRDLTGTVELTAQPLHPRTLEPLPGRPPFPIGSVFVGPRDLPAGQRLTSFGADRDTFVGNVTWLPTDQPPGVYRVEGVFKATPQPGEPVRNGINAFIRATPTPYLPGDGRTAEDFERQPPVGDGFGKDRLPYAGFTSAGWRRCETSGQPPCENPLQPHALPIGAVSTSRTWNATATDGPLAELSLLSLLSGRSAGLEATTPPVSVTVPAAVVARVPSITYEPATGRITVPPIEVIVPRTLVRVGSTSFEIPPRTVSTPAQELQVPSSASTPPAEQQVPHHEASTPALTLETTGWLNLSVSLPAPAQGAVNVSAPPAAVRVGSITVRTVPLGANGSAEVFVPAIRIMVPSIDLAVPGLPPRATPPLDLSTPPQTLTTRPTQRPGTVATPPQSLTTPTLRSEPAPAKAEATASFNDLGVTACGKASSLPPSQNTLCTFLPYNGTEANLSLLVTHYSHHSFLNDYYLSRRVDLRDCGSGCNPVLSFWHTGKLNWDGTSETREVQLPSVAGAGGIVRPPSAIQAASTDQASDNHTRGLVEVVLLDGEGVKVRQDLLPDELDTNPCTQAAASAACAPLASVECQAAPPVRDTPQGLVVPLVGPYYEENIAGQSVCPATLAERPATDAQVEREFTKPMPAWEHETIDLSEFRSHEIALSFHFQTTLGFPTRTNASNCLLRTVIAYCDAVYQEHWVLDNIRLSAAGPGGAPLNLSDGFFDNAGDTEGNDAHLGWHRFRLLRDVADANVALDPVCYAPVQVVALTPPNLPTAPRADAAACLTESRLKGPVVSVDGRGWNIFEHGADVVQKNGQKNPYYDGWFLDNTIGFQPPGREDLSKSRALRWGGPGGGGKYPPFTSYNLASTPLVSLAQTARPFAEFQANYSFSRADFVDTNITNPDPKKGIKDGGAVFLARYTPDPACAGLGGACPLVFDRRVIVGPEGGYNGFVLGRMAEEELATLVNWTVPGTAGGLNNGFVGRSGSDPLVSQWVPVRINLLKALQGLCLKSVERPDGAPETHSFHQTICLAMGKDANITWENGRGFNSTSGLLFTNLTGFDQDPDALYALEFHAQNFHDITPQKVDSTEDFGWALDDVRVGEQFLANDIGVSRIVFPRPGQLVGPGEELLPRVNVTNSGLFTQRGIRIHFNVTQQGAQVFPPPEEGRSVAETTTLGLAFPGLRDPNPQKNVSVAFTRAWVPPSQGLYTLNVWTELVGEIVGGQLVPLEDENPLNDRFTQLIEVREVHSVRLLPAREFPDDQAVQPLVGTAGDRRSITAMLENLGTVAEGDAEHRPLAVGLTILDEAGRLVEALQSPSITRIGPGRQVQVPFGSWDPPSGGLYELRFRVDSDLDLQKLDNERVVRVLVLTRLIPRPGEHWATLFEPDGDGWGNATRQSFKAGEGWSFGDGDSYDPLQDGSIVLRTPEDLTAFRNAVLTLNHSYDLETGYDGGVVEVSPDGERWQTVEPLVTTDEAGEPLFTGYPGRLTTASPEVGRPGDVVRAFTGTSGDRDGDGRADLVTSVIPLGTVDLTRSEPLLILGDTFDREPVVAGAELSEALGRWVEIIGNSTPPQGRAWWANKSLVWRPIFGSVDGGMTIEGRKELYAMPRGMAIPAIEAPLVVEWDEWRALGLSRRGGVDIQTRFIVPTAVEVLLERLNKSDPDDVTLTVPVLPRAADANRPYSDNYLEWTRRSIILPSSQAERLLNQSARLTFRLSLANSNNEAPPGSPANFIGDLAERPEDEGTGSPEDTDFISPNLGWAIASPRVYFVTNQREACEAAGLAFSEAEGRCFVFRDDLDYRSADDEVARKRWGAAWRTEHFKLPGVPPEVNASVPLAGGDPFVEGGWKLVDAVGFLNPKPVWDTLALAPARSLRGHVAEATGSGVEARLTRPLNLRGVASDALLTLEHSFKFTDLLDHETNPAVGYHGSHSGGRVEVSRDGGQTWEPLAPVVEAEDRLEYTRALEKLGFFRTYSRGSPSVAWQCNRPTHAGCLDPKDPFQAPGGWLADGQPHAWEPAIAASSHTPFAGTERDPERNSRFGIGSAAFAGTTCRNVTGKQGAENYMDPCGGAEDWDKVSFDVSKYAGQEVLLGLHVWFTTHRFTQGPHMGCTEQGGTCSAETFPNPPQGDDETFVPRDFWRVDNLKVTGRVLDGKPLFIRLRGFSDGNGERYGWDVVNVSLLGDKHLRNLGITIASPAAGEPLLGEEQAIGARVVNRGQEALVARGTVFAEQVGEVPIRNAGFEELVAGKSAPAEWAWEKPEVTGIELNTSRFAVEGARAVNVTVSAGNSDPHDPFRLSQGLVVPPGHWRLVGYADVENANLGRNGGAGVTLCNASGDDCRGDPTVTFGERAPGGTAPSNMDYQRFELPFVVEDHPIEVRLEIHAKRATFGGALPFVGVVSVDHLRVEPRPPPEATPEHEALLNGGFEALRDDGLPEDWTLERGQARGVGVHTQFKVTFPEDEFTLVARQGEVVGSDETEIVVPVEKLNLTEMRFTVEVKGEARVAADNVTVTITAPFGPAITTNATLPVGVRVEVPGTTVTTPPVEIDTKIPGIQPQNVPSRTVIVPGVSIGVPPNTQILTFAIPFPVASPPPEVLVTAANEEDALRVAKPPTSTKGVGDWRVHVRVEGMSPELENLHTEVHNITVHPSGDVYGVAAEAVPNPSAVVSVLEGKRSLTLVGTGVGPDDFNLTQALSLPAGKYRFEGLFASRDAKWTVTRDAEGPVIELANGGITQVIQTLRAGDLPRHVTGVTLWTNTSKDDLTSPLALVLADEFGTVLASNSSEDWPSSAGPVFFGFKANISLGVETLELRVSHKGGGTPISLQVHDGSEYPEGDLKNATGKDLRAAFHAPLEPTHGRGVLVVAGGAARGAPAALDANLNSTVDYHVRQVVDLSGLPIRRVTNVTVKVTLPAMEGIDPTPGDNDFKQNYALRQGELRAQLFDMDGLPLSEEAAYHFYDFKGNSETATVPATTTLARLNFTNAFLPTGTERLQVGLRAVNFTGAKELKLLAVPDEPATGLAPEEHELDGYLAFDGAPALMNQGCSLDPKNRVLDKPRHGCDLALNLSYAREGFVAIDALGAQGSPVLLQQPVKARGVLDQQNGGVPFAYDFAVPAGLDSTTLRIRAHQWQGEAVLDALRLVPLSQPAATFLAEVPPGASLPILDVTGAPPALATLKGARYAITAEAVALDASGAPLGEILLGDNRATLTTGQALGPGRIVISRLEADPNSVNLTTGQRALLRLTLRNEGATEAELASANARIERKDGVPIFEATQADFDPVPETVSFAPLQERVLTWPFQPDPTLPHGVYVLKATVGTQARGDVRVLPDGAASLVYLGTDFHSQFGFQWPFGNATTVDELKDWVDGGEGLALVDRWTSEGEWNAAYPPQNICNDQGREGLGTQSDPCAVSDPDCNPCDAEHVSEDKNFMWRKTAVLNLSSFRSITLGGDAAFPPGFVLCCNGQASAEGTIFAVVRSQAIAIPDMQRPQLIYADRHEFNGLEPEGGIFARLLDLRDPLLPAAFPSGNCLSQDNAHGWVQVDEHIQGTSPGFRANKWQLRNVDLGPLVDAAAEATLHEAGGDEERARAIVAERWGHVQLCWHLEQPSPRDGASVVKEWSIDDVTVSPYGMELFPTQRIPITDNVTKDFRLLLRNRGAYTDTYEVRLEEETGLPSRGPSNWKVSLLDEEGRPLRDVRVAPGQERTVTVRVHVDVAPPTLARSGIVDLAVTAVSKTTWLLRSTQHLLFEFAYPERANLRIAGLIVNDATLSVDKPRTVDVLVQNTGTVPAIGAELAVIDKMDPAFGVPPEELKLLDGSPIPPFELAPGDIRVVTVNWIPHVEGEHNLTAIADPRSRLLEFDERDNVLVKPILVPKAEFPDLLVEAGASSTNPGPGDIVEVSVRITNKGGAAAQGVQLSIRAGVTDLLPGDPPHVLPKGINPGETVSLNASWRPAFPGEQTIIVRAKTFVGILERLDTSGDNVVLLVIKVRSRGLDIVVPPEVQVQPGQTSRAGIEVHNRGDVDDTYRLTLRPPEDWRAVFAGRGEDTRLSVANHSSANLTLELAPPRGAEAGPYQVVLKAESENGTEVLEVHVVAVVPQLFGIRFTVEPELLLLPGKRFLPVTLENGGNGLDVVTVRARSLPEGWSVEPATFPVGPKARLTKGIAISTPTTTPEGSYPLVLEAQGRGGDLLAQRSVAQILPYELLALRLEGVEPVLVPGQAVEGRLVVGNEGNLPARAELRLGPPHGWKLRLERDVVSLAPGERRELALGLVVPGNASARQQALTGIALSGRGERYALNAPLRAAAADLALLELQQLPKGQVRDGATLTLVARVANLGEVPLAPTLAVYVDDQLLGFEPGPGLEPGAEVLLNASFRAKGGEHVVLAAVDPAQQVGEDDETNNARLLVLRVEGGGAFFAVPGPEPWLLALALGVALILRKRKAVGR